MNLTDLVPSKRLLSVVQGAEADLVKRRQISTISAVGAVAWAIIQVMIAARYDYLTNVGTFFIKLVSFHWSNLVGHKGIVSFPEFAGVAIFSIGLGTYFLLRWTGVLLKEVEEPFRYTFWVEPFNPVGSPRKNTFTLENEQQLSLLHRDLIEALSNRIQRLSLLNPQSVASSPYGVTALTSHIYISGDYAIREQEPGEWIIHVTPRIRIGPPSKPEIVAQSVSYTLRKAFQTSSAKAPKAGLRPAKDTLDVNGYKQLVERVYSRIATAIYNQIKADITGKIQLFPTTYLRAAALFHEAQDFTKSNTIDAYDHAIVLYKEALRYFDVANVRPLTSFCLKLPVFWRLKAKFVHTHARIQIGYAQSLNYRRIISALSGRVKNPLFETREGLDDVINILVRLHNKMNHKWQLATLRDNGREHSSLWKIRQQNRLHSLMALVTFPRDSWITRLFLMPSQALFEKQTHILFDAYVVAALTYWNLDSPQRAKQYLLDAKAVGLALSETDPLYLLTAATIEADAEKAILLFRQATEATAFEIAQYSLAQNLEMQFRMQDELLAQRAESVLREYLQVLAINPGNIAALASRGYLFWLLEEAGHATRTFENGLEIKAIMHQTFIGELNYGLARIAAEKGQFNRSYDLYTQAISADPGVAASTRRAGRFVTTSYYDHIGTAMLERFALFEKRVAKKITRISGSRPHDPLYDADGGEAPARIVKAVHAFVLNDYGNACFNYHFHTGDRTKLQEAIVALERAKAEDPDNKIIPYNLHRAYLSRQDPEDTENAMKCLEKAERLGPTWTISIIALAESRLTHARDNMKKTMAEEEEQINRAEQEWSWVKVKEQELARRATEDKPAVSVAGPKDAIIVKGGESRQTANSKELQLKVLAARQRRQESLQNVASLESKIQSQSEDIVQALPEVQKMIAITKLSAVFEGFEFNTKGNGIDRFLSAKVGRDRLDGDDVGTLWIWAEMLSSNYMDETALAAGEKLCHYILRDYYPDNFDVLLILRDLYLYKKRQYALKKRARAGIVMEQTYDQAIDEAARKLSTCTELLKPIVMDWLDRNPAHYANLTWLDEIFDDDQATTIAGLEKALTLEPKNAGYHNWLGNTYYRKAAYEQSIGSYRKAIENDTKTAVYHANLGEAFLALKRWEEAEKAYLKALTLEPKNASHHNALGNTYYGKAAYEQSIGSYRKAIENDPETAVYHANLGLAFAALKRWEEAETAYLEALMLEPKNASYHNALGNTYYGKAAYEQSAGSYRKAIENDIKPAVYHANLGLAFAALKRWKEAEKAYLEALTLEPKNAGYHDSLGVVYYRSADYEQSVDSFRKAIQDEPKVAAYHANLGEAFAVLKRWEEAEKAYVEALALDPTNASYHNWLGNTYYRKAAYEQSIDSYRKAIENDTKTAVYHANLGLAFAALQRWEEAGKAYVEALTLEPKNASHHNALGNTYYGKAAYEQSIDSYRKAIENDTKTAVYHANLGLAFAALKRWEEAEKAYLEALMLEPKNASHHNWLGNTYYGKAAYEQSIDSYRKAIENDTKTAVYHANLGEAFVALKRWEEAEKAYLEALTLEPKNASHHNALGKTYYRKAAYEQSIDSYRKAIENDTKTAVYHANLGEAFVALKRWEEAEKAYLEALTLEPKNASYHNALGNTYYRKAAYEQSVGSYRKAIENDTKTAVYYANLGLAFVALKRWEEAEKAYLEALTLEPKNASHHNALGNTYYRKAAYEQSVGSYSKAIENDAKTAVYRANLGLAFVALKRWEEAETAYREALKLEPKNASYHNALGNTYYGKAAYEQSVGSYRKAIENDIKPAVYHANLGLAFAALKRWGEAEKAYREVLTLEPGNVEAQAELTRMHAHVLKPENSKGAGM